MVVLAYAPMTSTRSQAWDASYEKRENHLFWPNEEVVRFLARYVRRRIAPDEWVDIMDLDSAGGAQPRLLDLGCGIGRHLVLAHNLGFEGHGIDFSPTAIAKAQDWLGELSPALAERAIVGDVRALPWDPEFFKVVISAGVLDSMPHDVAVAATREVHRVLSPGGYFYCDLIAFDERWREPSDFEVEDGYEAGTVQSYFDKARIESLFEPLFSVVDRTLITWRSDLDDPGSGRWYLVLRKS